MFFSSAVSRILYPENYTSSTLRKEVYQFHFLLEQLHVRLSSTFAENWKAIVEGSPVSDSWWATTIASDPAAQTFAEFFRLKG